MSMIGKTLAHYEITAPIGRGGMGEVFRAKDNKLGRDVAIKVLPEEFARDADRISRFQREAKLLASLNHPNIAAIYGLEKADGTNFLVLELVEGETLADRIKADPVPVEEALKLALQIAEALEAAHEKGVIHRDLKPANIKVTPEGKVKVLDFGLAKAFAGDQEVNLSNSPTLSDAATRQGVILGTAAYMSPEQARGKPVDKRTDIWAFGCVLYEMLTGQASFQGEDVTEILAAVVKGSPDLSLLPANLHARVREVIIRCLQKDLKKRYRDIADARYEIEQVLIDPSGVFVHSIATIEARSRWRITLIWAAAALFIGAIIAGVTVWKLKPPEPRRIMRFYYELPEDQQLAAGPFLAVSPDATQFVYGTSAGLYLRSVGELESRPIPGSDPNPRQPFFSPDGQWVGYWSTDNKLKKIAVGGGAPVVLADAVNNPLGPSWGADNAILYGQFGKGLMRIPANGGTPSVLIESRDQMLSFPQLLPDGKTVLFAQGKQIAAQSLKTGKRKMLFEGSLARYLPTGHIIYTIQRTLYAIAFNPDALEPLGRPAPILQDIQITGLGVPLFACSESGMLIYVPSDGGSTIARRSLVWVDRNGKEEPIPAPTDAYLHPRISFDGTRIALAIVSPTNPDIWIWDLFRKTMTRLTFDEPIDFFPLWTPDAKRIVFFSFRDNVPGIYWKSADGTGEAQALESSPERMHFPSCWSSDGNELVSETVSGVSGEKVLDVGAYISRAFQAGQVVAPGGTLFSIGILSTKNERVWKSLLRDRFWMANPQVSPDGRWIAYISSESGKNEVYVRPFPGVNDGKWQVSTNGGNQPRWARNGRELFYRGGDAVIVVAVETKPAFRAEEPKMLFRGNYYSLVGQMWDVSPDDKRFLMLKPAASTAAESAAAAPRPKINIVINWFEELKQRVPVK